MVGLEAELKRDSLTRLSGVPSCAHFLTAGRYCDTFLGGSLGMVDFMIPLQSARIHLDDCFSAEGDAPASRSYSTGGVAARRLMRQSDQ
jgi:hypothetical protein